MADERSELPEWVKPGAIFRMYYGPKHIGNRKMYIRAIVDGNQVVYRYWRKRKRYWHYVVEEDFLFQEYEKSPHFILVKQAT